MAPIFYCSCTNCICTATVLLKQERQEDKNDIDKGHGEEEHSEGQIGEKGHQDGGGQEYTYFLSGWDKPTDGPLLPADAQESGVGSIVLVVVLLLLAIGEDSRA